MSKTLKDLKYVNIVPKIGIKSDYINFLGIPLESMFEQTDEYTIQLDRTNFIQALKNVQNNYELGNYDIANRMVDSIMDEITLSKKHITERSQISEINNLLRDFVDDVEHFKILESVKISQAKPSTTKRQEITLDNYLSKNEDQLIITLGHHVSDQGRAIILNFRKDALLTAGVDPTIKLTDGSNKNLPTADQENYRFGQRLWHAIKRALYDVLCNPKDRTGKEVVTKQNMKKLIAKALSVLGINLEDIIFSAIALVSFMPLSVFCKMYEPKALPSK